MLCCCCRLSVYTQRFSILAVPLARAQLFFSTFYFNLLPFLSLSLFLFICMFTLYLPRYWVQRSVRRRELNHWHKMSNDVQKFPKQNESKKAYLYYNFRFGCCSCGDFPFFFFFSFFYCCCCLFAFWKCSKSVFVFSACNVYCCCCLFPSMEFSLLVLMKMTRTIQCKVITNLPLSIDARARVAALHGITTILSISIYVSGLHSIKTIARHNFFRLNGSNGIALGTAQQPTHSHTHRDRQSERSYSSRTD